MKYTPIGNTGISLPQIIFGTSALGNLYAEVDRQTKKAIVENCFEAMPYRPVAMDSAGKYGAGLALEELGRCLRELHIDPQEVIISNKLGWMRTELKTTEPTFEKGVWFGLKHDAVQDISYDGILRCWEQGNSLLGGNYSPQLLSVHDPDEFLKAASDKSERKKRLQNILDAYRALFELKKEGKVKAVGIGSKDWKIIREIANHVEFDWVMFANSMTIMNHPVELVEFMKKLHSGGTVIINSAVFQAGFLLGGDYYDYVKIKPDTPENISRFNWRKSFHEICREFGVEPMTACVDFALHAPGVSSVALNTSNPAHINENIKLYTKEIPVGFYLKMRDRKLIRSKYNYI